MQKHICIIESQFQVLQNDNSREFWGKHLYYWNSIKNPQIDMIYQVMWGNFTTFGVSYKPFIKFMK